ncbi:MAG TPA: peptidylprolyl isomerase [Flavobacteriaceae bacterium]|nr:peptidylprolyl isomerase [Flavobacteriaceae bacterium]
MHIRLLLVVLSLLILNCEDKQSSKIKLQSKTDSVQKTETKTEKPQQKKPDSTHQKLDEKNALEFFLHYEPKNTSRRARILTDFGNIEIELFTETKYHRANFVFLTKQRYFSNTQFYRVVPNFVIQAGNSDNPEIAKRRNRIGRYLLPKDTQHGFTHERGVLSMPSSEIENPHKLASPYEFFIVTQQGGAHHLDGDYTVFGKVIKGMDVVDEISKQPTDSRNWPITNIYIKNVELLD